MALFSNFLRIKKKKHDLNKNINYLVKNYTRVISNAPDYSNQYRFKSNIYSLNEQIFYPSILKSSDILHVPHYNAPLRFPGKLVVTVHDLCHLVMKEFFKGPAKRFYSSIFMRQVLKKSSVIITPSHFTKREILKYFNIDPKKIAVIHNGLDPHFYPRTINEQKTAQKANGFPNSYLLYVGNIKRHKNIKRLIQGYYKAWKQKSDLPKLFIVGQSDQGYDPYLEATSEHDKVHPDFENQVIFKGYVPYEDLPALYSGADVFIFPSLYEGFGFPPLEAMACGTPVIASNNSSLPEVLGDNALYVDPYDIHQITSSILKIYENAELVEPFINNGLKHVQQYSWEKAAEKHIEIYDCLAHKKRNILFVDQYSEYYGGGQIILIDLIKHIHKHNQWNLRVALPSSGNFSKEIKELGIRINGKGDLEFQNRPADDQLIEKVLHRKNQAKQNGHLWTTPRMLDICFHTEQWLKILMDKLNYGELIVSDYGLERYELDSDNRIESNVTAFFKHTQISKLTECLKNVGGQDLTYLVDFSQLSEFFLDQQDNYLLHLFLPQHTQQPPLQFLPLYFFQKLLDFLFFQ